MVNGGKRQLEKSTWIEPISQTRSTYRISSQDILLIESHECVTRASVTVDCLINLFDFFVLQKNIQKGTFVRWIAPSWRRCCVALHARSWIMINAESHVHAGLCFTTHSCGRERFILHTRKNKLRCWKIQVISFFRKYFSGLVPALYISLTSRTRVSNARHLQHCNAGHTVTVSLSLYYYTHAVNYSFKKKKKRNKLYTERLPFNRQPCREV